MATVMGPFAGYGAITKQVKKSFRFNKMYVSDINPDCVKNLHQFLDKEQKVDAALRNALDMEGRGNGTVNVIITDPPWGFYEQIDNIEQFYIDMLKEFDRILRKDGKIIVLSA